MALSTERLGLFNPEKPMENRLTDLGPRHFWQYFPPIIQNNYGKWKYHEILEPGVLDPDVVPQPAVVKNIPLEGGPGCHTAALPPEYIPQGRSSQVGGLEAKGSG